MPPHVVHNNAQKQLEVRAKRLEPLHLKLN